MKCDPAWRDFWRSTFPSVQPGYHLNKEHWNTIILDGTIPDADHVPCYRVVNSKGELSGAFAFGDPDEQANRLRADGIEVIDNKVDLKKYGMKL